MSGSLGAEESLSGDVGLLEDWLKESGEEGRESLEGGGEVVV